MIDALYNYRQGVIYAAEMKASYNVGFKDSVALMTEIK